MIQDRRDATQQPPLLHPGEVLEEPLLRDTQLSRRVGIRLGHDRHVALQRADDRDVQLVVGLRLELDRLRHLGGA